MTPQEKLAEAENNLQRLRQMAQQKLDEAENLKAEANRYEGRVFTLREIIQEQTQTAENVAPNASVVEGDVTDAPVPQNVVSIDSHA